MSTNPTRNHFSPVPTPPHRPSVFIISVKNSHPSAANILSGRCSSRDVEFWMGILLGVDILYPFLKVEYSTFPEHQRWRGSRCLLFIVCLRAEKGSSLSILSASLGRKRILTLSESANVCPGIIISGLWPFQILFLMVQNAQWDLIWGSWKISSWWLHGGMLWSWKTLRSESHCWLLMYFVSEIARLWMLL